MLLPWGIPKHCIGLRSECRSDLRPDSSLPYHRIRFNEITLLGAVGRLLVQRHPVLL